MFPSQERLGAHHRSRREVDDGLIVDGELFALEGAAQRRFGRQSALDLGPQHLVEQLDAPGRAPWLGTWRCRRPAASSPGWHPPSATAMPNAGRNRHLLISIENGSLSVARTRSAICLVSSTETSSQTTTNSSPPLRATVSPGRIAPAIRSPTCFSRSSPSVAEGVVDRLEAIKVEEHHAELRTPTP
jgi:hypothetical protein